MYNTMLNEKSPSNKKSKLTLEKLQETLPRTPYDKANWLEYYYNQNLTKDTM
jgi:hypothetical protein